MAEPWPEMAKTKLNRGGTGAGSHSGDGRREYEAAERAASRGRRCGNSGAAASKQLVAAPSGDAGRCFCFCYSVLFEPEEGEGWRRARQHGGGLGCAGSSGAGGRATTTARGDDCSSVFAGLRLPWSFEEKKKKMGTLDGGERKKKR